MVEKGYIVVGGEMLETKCIRDYFKMVVTILCQIVHQHSKNATKIKNSVSRI